VGHFKASVQYGDWQGTAAADGDHASTLSSYLETKGLTKPGEFLIAMSLWVGENHGGELGSIIVRAFLFDGPRDHESVRMALANISGAIPVRAIDLTLTLEQFVLLFKRFDIVLTWRGLELEDREYSARE
jgi:hypothetical protein